MHQTMERLYQVAGQLRAIDGQTRLADALNESPQTVNNWESRGISVAGALKAQREFSLDANWLLTGEGAAVLGVPLSSELRERIAQLDAAQLQRLENVIRAHLDMPVLQPDALTPAPPRLRPLPAGQNVVKGAERFKRDNGNSH